MSRKRAALSLTPGAEDFINDAPSEPAISTEPAVTTEPAPKRLRTTATKPSGGKATKTMSPLPKGHRVQVSGKVVRRLTGYISPELGQRLDEFLAREERNVGFVLERAIASWLDSKK